MADTSSPRPFDERAALQELERLAEKIQSTRRQRQRAVAEFESFVKTFREDRYKEIVTAQAQQTVVQAPKPIAPPPAPAARVVEPPPAPAPPRVVEAVPVPVRAVAESPRPLSESPKPAIVPPPIVSVSLPRAKVDLRSLMKAPRVRLAVAGTGVLALAVIVWLWNRSPDAAPPPPARLAPAARTEPPAPSTPQAVASTGPVDAAQPARALNMELITLRPVWTRVVVDGQKTIERLLPQDSRIPVSGDRAIAIRAGDAGAIRVTLNGNDQGVLGRDGQIAARTWTAAQR